MTSDEQRQILAELYENSKVKIYIKEDSGNLLANAQVIVGDIQEINGIQVWWSDKNGNINVQPPKYDRNHRLNAIWVRDEKIWHGLCEKVESEYKRKKEALGLNGAVEELKW